MRQAILVLSALLPFAACNRAAPPAPQARYTVGEPYRAGGIWRYPEERFRYDVTGVASVRSRGPGLTADGERYDLDAMEAAHPTLQLPAVARVTNLDLGRQVLVRLNDRGPADPGRLIALAPRAAALLGIPPGGTARVRVQVEEAPSEALRDALGAAPNVAVAAPVAVVTAEALPPPGARSARGPARALGSASAAQPTPTLPPDRLPATVMQVPPQPGALWLDLGEFHEAVYAEQRRAQLASLGARVEREGQGRSARYRVRAGPFATVPEADAALDQALRAGVSDAAITAE